MYYVIRPGLVPKPYSAVQVTRSTLSCCHGAILPIWPNSFWSQPPARRSLKHGCWCRRRHRRCRPMPASDACAHPSAAPRPSAPFASAHARHLSAQPSHAPSSSAPSACVTPPSRCCAPAVAHSAPLSSCTLSNRQPVAEDKDFHVKTA